MRDRIAAYLKESGHPLSADQILRDVLNIRSPNTLSAERVLRGILGQDSRFRIERGLWSLAAQGLPPPHDTAALALQWTRTRPRWYRGAVFVSARDASVEWLCTHAPLPAEPGPLRDARAAAEGRLLLAWNAGELREWNRLLQSAGLPRWEGESVFLSALAARAFPGDRSCRRPEDLAALLDLAPPDLDRQGSVARLLESAFRSLLQAVPAESRGSVEELRRWIEESAPKVDFSRFAFGREYLARIPESPGIYLMRGRSGEVIYVGKAGNLRRRVRSYFRPRALRDAKVARIHHQLHSLEILTCATEVEALLLEMRMIRDFRPSVNLQAEVHERPGRYGKVPNLILLAPVEGKAEIYYLKDGAFAARQTAPLGRSPSKAVQARVRNLYFGRRRGRPARAEVWETELIARWLSARKRHLNTIDVAQSAGLDDVVRRLGLYLNDPDRLARVVYYR